MQDDTFVFSELVVITSLGCIFRQECRFCRWTARQAILAHGDSFHLPAVSGSCCLLLKTSAKRDEIFHDGCIASEPRSQFTHFDISPPQASQPLDRYPMSAFFPLPALTARTRTHL